jgi:Protein of unknown function (DUF2867)
MPQVLTEEFKRLPLRVYTFLADVPLHDVYVVDLSRWRARVTLQGFLRTGTGCLCTPSRSCECCSTFDFRWTFLWVGSGPSRNFVGILARRLTDADRSNSLAAAGTRDGFFRVVYRFENEQLAELINRTAHVAALTALIETPTAYRYYLALYVRDVSPFTPFYMAMINPCRRRLVYPSFLRGVRARWNQAFGSG